VFVLYKVSQGADELGQVARYLIHYSWSSDYGVSIMFFSILIFLMIVFGFGYSLMYITKIDCEDSFVYWIVICGLGLAVFGVLSTFMSMFYIPLHYSIFVALSLIIPLWSYLSENFPKKPVFGMHEKLVVVLFVLVFGMMLQGSFAYPYLEDDDPWGHAEAAKYISVTHIASEPAGVDYHYIDPYPPAYDILMGVLHQTNNSISWTLKFFNSLLVGLTILFFYALMVGFIKDKNIALFSTFILAMTQSFMSHFICSQTYLIPIIIIDFY